MAIDDQVWQSLAQKVEAFRRSLTAEEATAWDESLSALMPPAGAAADDTRGHTIGNIARQVTPGITLPSSGPQLAATQRCHWEWRPGFAGGGHDRCYVCDGIIRYCI